MHKCKLKTFVFWNDEILLKKFLDVCSSKKIQISLRIQLKYDFNKLIWIHNAAMCNF